MESTVERLEATPSVVIPDEVIAWMQTEGPRLLRQVNQVGPEGLTRKETNTLAAIKLICPCHWTDEPREFAANGVNCEICGRQI